MPDDWTLESSPPIDRSPDAPVVQILNYDDQSSEILYRASAVGGCERKLWAARGNFPTSPPPDFMQAAYDRGHAQEPATIQALVDRGWQVRNPQGEVLFRVFTLPPPSNAIVSVIGHYDCEARYPTPNALGQVGWSEWMPCDVKNFGPSFISEYLAHGIENWDHYKWQQSIYVMGHPTAKRFIMPIWDTENDCLLESSLYSCDPHYTLKDLGDRLARIEWAHQQSQMPECSRDYPCPYYKGTCDRAPAKTDTLPPAAIPLLTARQKAHEKVAEWTTIKDTMTGALLALLPEGFSATYDSDTDSYTISVAPNSPKFNTAHAKTLLSEAGFDITLPEFTTPGKGYKLVVTTKEKRA
jgi:hypothetical protein